MATHARMVGLLSAVLAFALAGPLPASAATPVAPAPVEAAAMDSPAANPADQATPAAASPVQANTDGRTVAAVRPTVIDVLANDGPGAAGPTRPLTITSVKQDPEVILGSVTTDGSTVVYNPYGCNTGIDLFSYEMTDGTTSDTGTVAVTIARPASIPVTDIPQLGFVKGATIGKTVPMRLSWCGVAATSASVKGYRITQSTNGGASYPTVVKSATTATSSTRGLATSRTYAWLVRTTDSKGRTGAYTPSLTSRLTRYQENSSRISYSSGWKTSSNSRYSGKKERYTSKAGATATITVTNVRAFAIVASKARGRGSFHVYVDGVRVTSAAISEKRSKTQWRKVLYVRGLSSGAGVSHRIVVKAVGNGRIDLDAILTLSGKRDQAISFASAAPANATVNGSSHAVTASAASGLPTTLSLTSASWGACALAGGIVSFHGVGTCTVKATQPGDQTWNAASGQQTFGVAGMPQAITFGGLTAKTYGSGAFTVAATGGASGNPVTFGSQSSGVCSVSGTTVSLVAAGTCTVRATQAGSTQYAAATPVDRSFTVAPKVLTVIGITAIGRDYNGTTAASLITGPAVLVGVVGSDSVTLNTAGATGTFTPDANVGDDKTVLVSGLALGGTKAASYTLTQPTTTASIAKAGQVITFTTTKPGFAVKDGPTYTVGAASTSDLAVTITVDPASASVCTLVGNVVTFVDSGQCQLDADQPGNGNWNPASTEFQAISVASTGTTPQTITFGALANATYGTADVPLAASASSGLPVTLTSLTTSVCTVAGNAATVVAAGTCQIQAGQAGDPTWLPAPDVTRSFTVAPKLLTVIGITAIGRDYNGTTAASLITGPAVLVGVVGSDSVTLNTAGATGTFTPDANVGDDKTVLVSGLALGGTKAASYTLTQPTTTASIAKANLTVTAANKAIIYGQSDPTFTFTYGSFVNGETATVVDTPPSCGVTGAHTDVAGSPYAIDCSGGADNNYQFAPVAGTLTITPKPLTVTFTAANRPYDATTAAAITGCSAAVIESGDAVTCSHAGATASFATAAAGIDKAVTGTGFALAGADAGNYSLGPVNPTTATIHKANAICTITGYSVTYNGSPHTATGTCLGVQAETLAGLVLTGTIHTNAGTYLADPWTFTDVTGNYNDTVDTVVDSIAKASQEISITSTAPTGATVGGPTYTVTATGGASGNAVTFTIAGASSSVCSISGSLVSFLAAGTCTIQANQAGNANYDAAPQTIQDVAVGLNAQTITFGALGARTYGDAPFTVSASASSTLPVSFGSQTPGVCTVGGTTVTVLAAGDCTIRATQGGNGTYAAAPFVDRTFTVAKASQEISITSTAPTGATVGGPTYTVTATGGASGNAVTFTIAGASSSVCSISGSLVSFLAAGTCTIQANQAGNANYDAAPQTIQDVAVGLNAQTITFGALGARTYGDAPFTVSASASSTLPVSFGSQTPGVCTVGGTTVTVLAAGDCTIRATQGGNGTYAAAPFVDRTFTVAKRAITVTAATDSKVADGTTDSSATPMITSGSLASGDTDDFTQAFDTPAAGTGKTLTPTGTVMRGATDMATSYLVTWANATGTITPAAASLSTSTIIANPASITADGIATSTITVRLKDQYGNDLVASGGAVTLAATAGTLDPVTDNGDGTYTATYTSDTTPGAVTITGKLDGIDLVDDATITLT